MDHWRKRNEFKQTFQVNNIANEKREVKITTHKKNPNPNSFWKVSNHISSMKGNLILNSLF